jgi:hypothetical protein
MSGIYGRLKSVTVESNIEILIVDGSQDHIGIYTFLFQLSPYGESITYP